MEFSENQPFLSGKKIAILRFFVRKKSGLWPKLIIFIWPPETAILSGNFIPSVFCIIAKNIKKKKIIPHHQLHLPSPSDCLSFLLLQSIAEGAMLWTKLDHCHWAQWCLSFLLKWDSHRKELKNICQSKNRTLNLQTVKNINNSIHKLLHYQSHKMIYHIGQEFVQIPMRPDPYTAKFVHIFHQAFSSNFNFLSRKNQASGVQNSKICLFSHQALPPISGGPDRPHSYSTPSRVCDNLCDTSQIARESVTICKEFEQRMQFISSYMNVNGLDSLAL